jgi:hypothetical protein
MLIQGPQVVGIATQYSSVGRDASISNLYYGSFCANKPNSICYGEYRLAFSNGNISDMSIKTDSGLGQGLTDPDILFALTNVPASGITVTLQGKDVASNGGWYDVDVPTQFIKPPQTTVKFSENTGTLKKLITQ